MTGRGDISGCEFGSVGLGYIHYSLLPEMQVLYN